MGHACVCCGDLHRVVTHRNPAGMEANFAGFQWGWNEMAWHFHGAET